MSERITKAERVEEGPRNFIGEMSEDYCEHGWVDLSDASNRRELSERGAILQAVRAKQKAEAL